MGLDGCDCVWAQERGSFVAVSRHWPFLSNVKMAVSVAPFVAARAISQIIISKGLIAARSTFVWLPLQLNGRPPTPTALTPGGYVTLKSFTGGIKPLSESLYSGDLWNATHILLAFRGKHGCIIELDILY